jgi:hypothetical protein
MDLIVIFKQRKESYPEQYAPELVAACTEYEMEDGASDWMDTQEAEAKVEADIVAVKRFRFKFKDAVRSELRKVMLEDHVIETPCDGVEQENANGTR